MPAERKVRESLRQEKWEDTRDPDCHIRAVTFDDGCPHNVGADDEREVQFADFELEPGVPLDRAIIH